jgi:divalent metal cation (Fe/Co/Zn/Cd) transporter
MLDGIEPHVMGEIRHAAEHVEGIQLHDAKARWLGHRLHADISAGVDPGLPVSEAIRLGETLKKELAAHMPAIASVSVSFTEAK